MRGTPPAASNPRRHHPEHRGSAAASTVLPTAPADTTAMKGSHCTQNAKQSEANTSRMSNDDAAASPPQREAGDERAGRQPRHCRKHAEQRGILSNRRTQALRRPRRASAPRQPTGPPPADAKKGSCRFPHPWRCPPRIRPAAPCDACALHGPSAPARSKRREARNAPARAARNDGSWMVRRPRTPPGRAAGPRSRTTGRSMPRTRRTPPKGERAQATRAPRGTARRPTAALPRPLRGRCPTVRRPARRRPLLPCDPPQARHRVQSVYRAPRRGHERQSARTKAHHLG